MKLYNCQVRLSGNINHTVPRFACTEHEILVLRNLHGNDAIVNIKQVGDDTERSESSEYRRLATAYGQDKIENLFMVKLDLNAIVEDSVEDETPEITMPASVQQAMKAAGEAQRKVL